MVGRSSPGRSTLDTSHDAAGRKRMLQPGPGRPERPRPCPAEVADGGAAGRGVDHWGTSAQRVRRVVSPARPYASLRADRIVLCDSRDRCSWQRPMVRG